MVHLAWNAVRASFRLDATLYGRPLMCDLQARAAADLGNAYRVANVPQSAERALQNARRLFEQGTGDPLLEVRLLDFEASLLAQIRHFVPATQKLLKMLTFHEKQGDRHLIGRTLVKLGLFAGYDGNCELALQWLEQSLELIDEKRDPGLACAAAHNLILFLVDSGRIAQGKKLRLVHSRRLIRSGGRITQLKFRDLDGRIAYGEGNHLRAEAIFREVRAGFIETGLPILAGISMINLTAALLAQGKAREAERTVTQASRLFVELGLQREALQAVILLRDSFRMRAATLAMVKEVSDFLRRVMWDPGLRFEAWSWEKE
ncbi:MAG TPA: hypothetical protein VGX68_16290 [Thermoanaerobaculia bacterium]|nr:hypothetical protein [Thermoanaerobaculia bacterium]